MLLKRAVLLILGFAGSALAAAALYISAEGVLIGAPQPHPFTEPTQPQITNPLPILIPETTLLAESLSAYDGPFLEDGTDVEVTNVAALQVLNTGDFGVLKTLITLRFADSIYVFYAEHIPAGERIVLLEQTAKPYRSADDGFFTGWQVTDTAGSTQGVQITDRSMGTLVVTNTTDRTLRNIRLYYKAWLSPPDVYMGGIAYKTELPLLLPGQTVYLYPSHYAAGYSKVVAITAEE